MTYMKTTLDLPDDLLIEAKAVAARRRTTLKAMIESALRRELAPLQEVDPASDQFEVGELGFLVLKNRGGLSSTSETVRQMIEEAEEEDFQEALRDAGKA